MKLQLDTSNKTVKIEESVGLRELMDTLDRLLPNGEWKEFKLETNTVIKNWSTPIIIRERSWPYLNAPWYTPIGVGAPAVRLSSVGSGVGVASPSTKVLKSGTYNIEA
jgi:hypothetical protein